MNVITYRPAAAGEPEDSETLSVRMAARLLDLSPGAVRLLLATGYLADLKISSIATLARRPYLVCDGHQPVLRQGLAAPADDGREFIGESTTLTDAQALQACRMWWRCDPQNIVDAKLLPVTISGFVVSALLVREHEETIVVTQDGKNGPVSHPRHAFVAELVGRVRNLVDLSDAFIADGLDAETLATVRAILGARSDARSGGPIAYLPNC